MKMKNGRSTSRRGNVKQVRKCDSWGNREEINRCPGSLVCPRREERERPLFDKSFGYVNVFLLDGVHHLREERGKRREERGERREERGERREERGERREERGERREERGERREGRGERGEGRGERGEGRGERGEGRGERGEGRGERGEGRGERGEGRGERGEGERGEERTSQKAVRYEINGQTLRT